MLYVKDTNSEGIWGPVRSATVNRILEMDAQEKVLLVYLTQVPLT